MKTALAAALACLAAPALALDCGAGQRAFAHPAGETCIPADPQRIVTLQDQNGLLPLLELGVVPVGSAGHQRDDGTPFFRRTEGFDTAGVAFVGSYSEPDAEAVAALDPDLIIAGPWPEGQMQTFAAIAPTIVFDPFSMPLDTALLQLADAVGRLPEARALQAATEAHAARLRAALGDRTARTTLSFLEPDAAAGMLGPVSPGQVAGLAFRLLALTRVPAQAALAPGEWREVGLESLPDHQGDVIFAITYDAEGQGTAFDAFVTSPLVAALPVAQAGQIRELDGTRIVGSGWTRVTAFMDRVAAVLADDTLNRDIVTEQP